MIDQLRISSSLRWVGGGFIDEVAQVDPHRTSKLRILDNLQHKLHESPKLYQNMITLQLLLPRHTMGGTPMASNVIIASLERRSMACALMPTSNA